MPSKSRTVTGVLGGVFCSIPLMTAPLAAADLGGNCCADLEERIAELEATTARKGNRKVTLTVTGWVNNQVMTWDDGFQTNTYVVDQLPDLASRVGFTGSAQITPHTKAGYQLTMAFDGSDAFLTDQFTDNAGTGAFLIHSYWYLDDSRLGKLSVGFLQHASDNTTFDIDRSGTIFPSNQVLFDGASMVLRPTGGIGAGYALGANPAATAARWRDFNFCENVSLGINVDCAGDRRNAVRYDTPALFGGLVLSTSWGEDDFWDAKAVYNSEFNGVLVGLSGSYTWSDDDEAGPGELAQAGLFLKHTDSGLFLLAAYNKEWAVVDGHPDGSSYYLKGGIARKPFTLGTTYFYGDFGQGLDQYGGIADPGRACGAFFGVGGAVSDACASAADTTVGFTGSEFTRWGLILQQDIDAAGMTVWAKYYNYSLEADFFDSAAGVAGRQEFEDLNMYTVGAAIFF